MAIRILLVEDDELNRDMLSRRLTRSGYEVLIAVNGQEAIDKTNSEQPDIVLMDMGLPIIDGATACRQLKNSEKTKDIPIIALTALAMVGDREKTLEAGCNDYDTKPIDYQRLVTKIEILVKK